MYIHVSSDPVHDFGFFRFDPNKVKFLDLHEIPLRPEGAKSTSQCVFLFQNVFSNAEYLSSQS